MKKRKHGASACALLAACLTIAGARVAGAEISAININEEYLGPKSAEATQIFTEQALSQCALEQSTELWQIEFDCENSSEIKDNVNNNLQISPQNQENDKDEKLPPRPEPRSEMLTSVLSDNVKVGSRIYELLFGGDEGSARRRVALGGTIFGVKIKQAEVTVQDAKGIPALSRGDVIHSINGISLTCAQDAAKIISSCGGNSITIKASRRGMPITLEVRPTKSDGTYTLGLTLRDGAMGIGTMTFYDPETGLFGGLGHAICDHEGASPVSMKSGEITGALLGGVRKGECGKAGELSGILTGDRRGYLTSNNECGVFGYLDKIPTAERLVEVGTKSEIHEGEATVISTLKNGKSAEYKIKIYDVDKTANGSKCFRIKVTDPVLLALSGGIVRGMSGSPIIQDGKLVGAVTHVLVADPTEGYGIFIENMLSAAENTVPKAA